MQDLSQAVVELSFWCTGTTAKCGEIKQVTAFSLYGSMNDGIICPAASNSLPLLIRWPAWCTRDIASLVRYSLHFHLLSHMAVHHLHHLHYHHFHLLLLIQSFILNLTLGSLPNPFHHRPLIYRTDFTDSLTINVIILHAHRPDLFVWRRVR